MKVCLIAPVPYDRPQSAALLCGQLADGLAERGHAVVRVCPPARKRPSSLLFRFVRELAVIPVMIVRAAIAVGPTREVDVVIVYSPPVIYCLAASFLAAVWSARLVVWVQDNYSEILEATGAVRNRVLLWSVRKVERSVFDGAARVVAAGVGTVKNADPAKVAAIGNWVF